VIKLVQSVVKGYIFVVTRKGDTLAARGLEEPCASFPDFCDTDSRFTWIHDFEENLTESVGPVPFSAQYLICRPGRTD